MEALQYHILNKIRDHRSRKIFILEHFRKFGIENAVHQALSRLENEGHLVRSVGIQGKDMHVASKTPVKTKRFPVNSQINVFRKSLYEI